MKSTRNCDDRPVAMVMRTVRILCGAIAVLHTAMVAAAQTPSAQTLYADALAKEQAVRAALVDHEAAAPVLKAVRTVVADFEAVVRHHPTSGYSDDALWHAARLSLDAFRRFEQAREKTAGERLLRLLASEYPTSRLAKQVPALLAEGSETSIAVPLAASRASRLATIKDITRTVLRDAVRVTIELDREVPFHDERLDSPSRVFVDLPSTRAAPALLDRTLRFESDADVVRQVRVGRQPNSTTRVVLDVGGISTYSVYPLYSPYRLVIECLRAPGGATPATRDIEHAISVVLAALPSTSLGAGWAQALPAISPEARETLEEAQAPAPAPLAATALAHTPPATAARPPATNLAGGFSMSRQLGLRVSRIVIDPGHGGHDPGAIADGVTEAEVVLDIALRLERLLAKAPGMEIVLTRRTDAYVPLQERTAIANREAADLFLSIHANASANRQAGGVETYFLNFATNRNAEAVAARENAASGQAMASLPSLVKAITLNNKLHESRDFATYVQRAMVERLKGANRNVRDLGVKQAPFVVLIGAAMPSVLAEISFLTNPQEVRLLKGSAYRQRIAEALANAVGKYQTSLHRETKVAQQ